MALADSYFRSKAEQIEKEIYKARVESGWKLTSDKIAFLIYLGLKDVAKDQRYSAVKEINSLPFDEVHTDLVNKIIMNS